MSSEIKVEGDTRLDPEFERLLREAQATLDFIIRNSADSVHATWTVRKDDKGQYLVDLVLSDDARRLNVLTHFAPGKLNDADRVRQELREVWGDLLLLQMAQINDHLKSILASEGLLQ